MNNPADHTILYIEDDPEMINLVTVILNHGGYRVQGASGGQVGLEMIGRQRPDLILLDLMMPDMDGWDVYHQLKAQETTRDIPVIIVTARSQDIDRVLGLQIAKADDYICKPFHPQDLLDSVARILAAPAS